MPELRLAEECFGLDPRSEVSMPCDGLPAPPGDFTEPSRVRPTAQRELAAEASAGAKPDSLDRLLHAREARFTGSLSLISLTLAYLDWIMHLANAPGRRLELAQLASRQWARLAAPAQWTKPLPGDHRFGDESWTQPPFNFMAQAFLLGEEWWRAATVCLPGVAKSHADVVAFAARQTARYFLAVEFSLWTNPEVSASDGGAFG